MNREHNMKTVTVVIPSYNRAKILPKTIPTYLQPDVNELIIIDDCSSDNTEQVVKKLQKKYPIIKYFTNEVNSKQTFSKNVGIKNATCDYIYFGDDDSIIKPGTIKRLIEVKEKFGDSRKTKIVAAEGEFEKLNNRLLKIQELIDSLNSS